jgi:hypothetical protein
VFLCGHVDCGSGSAVPECCTTHRGREWCLPAVCHMHISLTKLMHVPAGLLCLVLASFGIRLQQRPLLLVSYSHCSFVDLNLLAGCSSCCRAVPGCRYRPLLFLSISFIRRRSKIIVLLYCCGLKSIHCFHAAYGSCPSGAADTIKTWASYMGAVLQKQGALVDVTHLDMKVWMHCGPATRQYSSCCCSLWLQRRI